MGESGHGVTLLFIYFIASLVIISPSKCHKHLERNVTSLFVFGDSLFDVGNNNYIQNSPKSNFFPYGETFFNHPTGRFSDGRVLPDFIAEYANLPFIPPYLQPRNREFEYGVNFASGGARVLDQSLQGHRPKHVLGLNTQIGYFKNVRRILKKKLGEAATNALLARAVYYFSAGNNDYSFTFNANSSVLRSHPPQKYVKLVVGNITEVIKEIYNVGGRKFAFESTGPIGCVPANRISQGRKKGACFKKIAEYLKLQNKEISAALNKLNMELKGFKYSLVELYSTLEDMSNHPSKFGFKVGKLGCFRGINCGEKKCVCRNVSEYVFFDSSGHPTERVNKLLAKKAWSGKPSLSGPYNLKALFGSK